MTRVRMMTVMLIGLVSVPCQAAHKAIYVNNRTGIDANDGSAPEAGSAGIGPVQTIRRALVMCRAGETIILADTGIPYYEPLAVRGGRHSGTPRAPFEILGGGATLSGAAPIPPNAWRRVRRDDLVWRWTPWRKGHYQLIRDGSALAEVPCRRNQPALPELADGEWCAWKGSIYYRSTLREIPAEIGLEYARHGTGISLFGVHDVLIRDLKIQHFRVDGVNAHDKCTNVILENVRCVGNGRAGFAVGGTAQMLVRSGGATANRQHSAIISGLGLLQVDDAELDAPPTVRD